MMDESLASVLDQYTVYQSDDIAKIDLELVHDICERVVCDVQATDTLAVLASTALLHEDTCPGQAEEVSE